MLSARRSAYDSGYEADDDSVGMFANNVDKSLKQRQQLYFYKYSEQESRKDQRRGGRKIRIMSTPSEYPKDQACCDKIIPSWFNM